MKTVYNLIDDIMLSKDLITCGNNMLTFAEKALQEKNRKKIVDDYKKRLSLTNARYLSMFFDKPEYYYISGSGAVTQYLMMRTNLNLPPIEFLKSVAELGQNLLDDHLEPSGHCIDECTVQQILSYLNQEYDLQNKVYGECPPIIILNDNSHKYLDGLVPITKAGEPFYIFLYHRVHEANYSPVYVLLHEIGHIVQRRYGSTTSPPESFYDIVSEKGLQESPQAHCEHFANTFAMAVLFESPFAQFDHYVDIPLETRQMIKEYIKCLFV